jgi:catechol 2,3-dioxygenase-like lactoylglutathione lyase family enzyme
MTATFTKLRAVAVPVTDQERSKTLFEDLGFATTMDAELQPGFRWLELALPGDDATLALVTTGDQLPTGVDTGIRLVTTDARSAHASLSDKGLEVGELLDWESTPLMFSFTDPDGNRFYVSEG